MNPRQPRDRLGRFMALPPRSAEPVWITPSPVPLWLLFMAGAVVGWLIASIALLVR